MTQDNYLQGKRVRITATSNPFAKAFIGMTGTITGDAPLGMVSVTLDDGTPDYWAMTYNLEMLAS